MALELNSNKRSQTGFAITVIACAVLHLALAPHINIFGGRVNFMLVLTAVLAISGDSRAMVYIGFFSGLFYDLTTTGPIGLMSLLLAVMGYTVALVSRGLSTGLGMETVRVAIVSVLGVNIVYAIALCVMGFETSLLTAVVSHGLTSSLLDIAACVPLLMLGGTSTSSGRGFSSRGGMHSRGLSYKPSRCGRLR